MNKNWRLVHEGVNNEPEFVLRKTYNVGVCSTLYAVRCTQYVVRSTFYVLRNCLVISVALY